MTTEPRAFLAIDHGAATMSIALIGQIHGTWRLVGSMAVPVAADLDATIAVLGRRLRAADPVLADGLALAHDGRRLLELPRIEARSARPRRLAVVAGSERTLASLTAAAARSGWRPSAASMETADPLEMSQRLLAPDVDAILAGAADPPRAEERGSIRELAALVAAVAARRPELPVILAGAMSEGLASFGDVGDRPGEVVLGPAAPDVPSEMADSPLADLLLELALPADDPRRALAAATQTLADLLDRRIEIVALGHDASVRSWADPSAGGHEGSARIAVVADAAVALEDPDDEVVDGVLAWSTVATDRHRMRDRLRELRIAPWADAAGDGAALRMAAARAAMVRLAAATPDRAAAPPPDLLITAGGVWTSIPATAVALAVSDVIRRPGASQFALDHARLLGPLGTIADAAERGSVMADLTDDMLAPLGTVVTPAGLRSGRSAGSMVLRAGDETTEVDLLPGGIELVDLPAGATAATEFRFRDTVRLPSRGRHFALDASGGLSGLVVDLRDVPLRLPERADRRRDLLRAWQAALWPESAE